VLACFAWAADPEEGAMIARCPFKRIKWVSTIPYEPRRPASTDEYLALVRHSSLALRQGLLCIYRTGCRPCEMRELIWPWVQLDAASPHLELIVHKTVKKTGKPKLIGLDDVMQRFLRDLQKKRTWTDTRPCRCSLTKIRHTVGDHVFLNCDGTAWSRRAFAQNIRRCAERAGLDVKAIEKKVSAGCLRTTFACDLIEAGISNRKVADALGHTTTWMVDHVYGAATRHKAAHLEDIAKQAAPIRGAIVHHNRCQRRLKNFLATLSSTQLPLRQEVSRKRTWCSTLPDRRDDRAYHSMMRARANSPKISRAHFVP